MRIAAIALAGTLGLAVYAGAAAAAPSIPGPDPQVSIIIQVSGRCGRGFHRSYRGYCVRNWHPRYRPYYGYRYRPYYGPYSYYPYQPWTRPSPSDYVADQLNAQQLRYGYWGY